jgi:hypothetical protein
VSSPPSGPPAPGGVQAALARHVGKALAPHILATGGIFDASGKNFYVSIQHNISGKATILDITGWHY